ncbi:MAG: class I adenylate-forming enzyme family protein [Mycobacterium sp.]|nr:class I adenylate-forming enzyme family protein [Mycobacterium sp.]
MTVLAGDFANTREVLEAAAVAYGDREAYVEPGSRISFADWASRSRRVAAGLVARGVRKGDVVALRLPSGADYATCYAAAAMIGAITTGINPRLGPREVGAILEQAEPALVISQPAELRRISADGDRFPAVPDVEINRHDPVALIFSSGTTGLPKGAVFDGNNLLAGATSAGVMSAPYDRRLTSTPFAHAGYMFKLWDQLLWGTTLVIPPAPWSAAGMATALREERITVAGAVPTQWAKLLEVSPAVFPHLRVGVAATAPASPELVRAVADRIGVPLVVRYAMTECPTICGTEPDDPPEIQFRTVGRPAPGMAVRLTGDGAVEVRGPCVMRGYWRNPELTAEVLRDGWLGTGDLGVVHDDGTLSLIGRRGDMYIRGGFNVHPVEVEQVIATHPAVARAVVVGCQAPVIGEIGVAFVVPKDASAPPSLPELRTHVCAQLADYKAPDHLVVVEDIPLTAMLKPDRSALLSLAASNVVNHRT